MLFTAASALVYVKNRRLIEVFPENAREVWEEWELRVLILLSLTSQVVLLLLGNCRKYVPRYWIRVTLWSAYLLADWVATVALGVISRNAQEDQKKFRSNPEYSKNELVSFWAPFLLLHLGGPDTITAYALEDNQLWLRHLVGLLIQTAVAFYIFLVSLPASSLLPFLSIFIFQAGILKYSERTRALMSANSEHLRDSMLTPADPGPNYAKFMEDYTLKKAEGFHVTADEVREQHVPTFRSYPEKGKLICEAYGLFQTFKCLFVDLILSFQDREHSQSYFQKLSSADAFRVIEIELGFAFDVFYTKAPVAYTKLGCMFRLANFSCIFSVLVIFALQFEKGKYSEIDIIITYLLLGIAVLSELYNVIVMVRSDWTVYYWLSKHDRTRKKISILPSLENQLRWSNSMAQYNLLSFCLVQKPASFYRIQKLLHLDGFLEKHHYKMLAEVSSDLKGLIFEQFMKFTGKSHNPKALCTRRGSFSLKENDCPSLEWSTTKVEFDQSILIWHVATDLCYYLDEQGDNATNVGLKFKEISKCISDYMLYLLVMCPFMLPIGIGIIRFRDTCAEAREFFKEKDLIDVGKKNKANVCYKLLKVNTEVSPAKVKGDRSKSVLFDACMLAKSLRQQEKKWEIMSQVWVEMLAYAATHCRANHHAQQLRKGGELLTHVWLLMAHLGITEQFQISEGHARAKLIVK